MRDECVSVSESNVPSVGFGTYQMDPEECEAATRAALETGYRHIDTAMAYENEAAVGRAIRDSGVPREDIFLTTKVKGYPEYLTREGFLRAAEGCLERLDTDYVDLLLVHWWFPTGDMAGVMDALNQLVDEGKVRHIGVSNFSIEQLKRAMRLSDEPIFTNQVEYHPYFDQEKMLAFCRANDVLLTAYSPLAQGRVVDDEVLTRIGARYGKTAAQVAIRWLVQQEGVVTIPKSATERYIRENRDVFDFALTEREMHEIDELEGPLLYRLNSEGGPIYEFRAFVGPLLPSGVVDAIRTVGASALTLTHRGR
ncbi:aldo/keto reductase [Halomarina litorea]|uniref:aldo/keto reductase n=1 Tax=Halomarina litorea TaxID=2961595 RepID=UPI0021142CC4|nr:aldo/keto reductase [Halomarina sp. BCD28]